MRAVVPVEVIKQKIYLIRSQKVMLDNDLAELYGVETFNLNKAVKRNIERFPIDFMFQLNKEEANALRFQIGISKNKGRGGRRYLPYVFTEQGVAMLSSVLKSKRAVQVNIVIMRTFVKLREMLATHKKLARKLMVLEEKIGQHDEAIHGLFEAMKRLMIEPESKKRKIGFVVRERQARYRSIVR
jgi:phage regulator Rha-like protein